MSVIIFYDFFVDTFKERRYMNTEHNFREVDFNLTIKKQCSILEKRSEYKRLSICELCL